jgi:hypothetical protein
LSNSDRIPELVTIIESIWLRYPDLRLGQLISNCMANQKVPLYFLQDEDLVELLIRKYGDE